MPTVSTYGARKVSTSPFPGVRKTAAETPESTGVGLDQAREQTGEQLGRLGQTVTGVGLSWLKDHAAAAAEERRQADIVAVLDFENGLAEWEQKRVYDNRDGALTLKGKNSYELPEQIAAEYDAVAGDLTAKLGTDKQRIAAQRIKQQRGQQLALTIQRHVFGEREKEYAASVDASVDNHVNAGLANATDGARITLELGQAVQTVRSYGATLGQSDDAIAQHVAAVQTKMHVGVIESLLAQRQTTKARIYFEAKRGEIDGDALARVTKALEVGTTRAEGQKASDAILAAGGSLAEQRTKARAIDDPDVRDDVMQRLEHESAVNEKQTRDADELKLRTVYDIVDKTKNVANIPPAIWASLDGGARSSLRSYANGLAKGVPVETDLPTYYGLMTKAGADPETFATMNLLGYKGHLGEAEFKQLAGLQLSIRNGDRTKADRDLAGFRTHSEIIDGSLAQYGMDPKAKEGTPQYTAIAQLRRMVDNQVASLEANTGKKPSNADIQDVVDKILSTSEKIPGSWWGGLPFTAGHFFDSTKRAIELTIADVPAAEQVKIAAKLRKYGLPVSDATVLDLYITQKAGAK